MRYIDTNVYNQKSYCIFKITLCLDWPPCSVLFGVNGVVHLCTWLLSVSLFFSLWTVPQNAVTPGLFVHSPGKGALGCFQILVFAPKLPRALACSDGSNENVLLRLRHSSTWSLVGGRLDGLALLEEVCHCRALKFERPTQFPCALFLSVKGCELSPFARLFPTSRCQPGVESQNQLFVYVIFSQ